MLFTVKRILTGGKSAPMKHFKCHDYLSHLDLPIAPKHVKSGANKFQMLWNASLKPLVDFLPLKYYGINQIV